MISIVEDRLIDGPHFGGRADRLTRPIVAQPTRMRAAGDDQAQAMPALEAISRGPQIDFKVQSVRVAAFGAPVVFRVFDGRFGLDADQSIAYVERLAVGLHVAQTTEEIGVRQC